MSSIPFPLFIQSIHESVFLEFNLKALTLKVSYLTNEIKYLIYYKLTNPPAFFGCLGSLLIPRRLD